MKALIYFIFLFVFIKLNAQCPETFNFGSQNELDSFAIKYPDCDSVKTGVLLSGNITDPSPLDQIVFIDDYLIIQNTQIEQLNHFPNLVHVGNFIDITDNTRLKTVEGFSTLDGKHLKAHLSFQNNDSLVTINLQTIGDAIFDFIASSNPGLQQISVPNLISLGSLELGDNEQLEMLDFPLLKIIQNNFVLSKHKKLDSLGNVDALEFVGGKVQIQENSILQNLDISHIKGIKAGLMVEQNPSLEEIYFPQEGMDTTLFIKIIGNNSIKKIDGPALNYIQLYLEIAQNEALEEIVGFTGLNKIKLSTKIYANPNLSDISGFEEIVDFGNEFQLYDNALLSICALPSICNRLSAGKNSLIENNGTHCLSEEEVILLCTSGDSELGPESIQIFPNPADQFVQVLIIKEGLLRIFSADGRLVKSQWLTSGKNIVDIGDLYAGMYIIQAGTLTSSIEIY